MRKIIFSLRNFLAADFHAGTYAATIAMMAILLTGNYVWGWANATVYDPNITGLRKLGMYTVFFGVPYLAVLGFQTMFQGGLSGMRAPKYWVMVALALGLMILTIWAPWHIDVVKACFPKSLFRWGNQVLWNCKRLVFFLLPLWVFWKIWDRKETTFYGLWTRPKGLAPYFWMLAIVLPMVIAASFQPDFLSTYPQYRPGNGETRLGISPWLTCGLFELVYGADFMWVELAYRGVLVIGLSRWMGPRAVLPMAALYCTIHFGKPMGEAIASFFGGYILGVMAYETRNIWGGIVVHVGLAWMMEGAAWLQRL